MPSSEKADRYHAAADTYEQEQSQKADRYHAAMDTYEQERYTREVIDPVTRKEYTVNVAPYSWGYKCEVRDNEQGTVIQDGGVYPSFSVAMEDGRQWIESREEPERPITEADMARDDMSADEWRNAYGDVPGPPTWDLGKGNDEDELER